MRSNFVNFVPFVNPGFYHRRETWVMEKLRRDVIIGRQAQCYLQPHPAAGYAVRFIAGETLLRRRRSLPHQRLDRVAGDHSHHARAMNMRYPWSPGDCARQVGMRYEALETCAELTLDAERHEHSSR
jgi:hypothetical protein